MARSKKTLYTLLFLALFIMGLSHQVQGQRSAFSGKDMSEKAVEVVVEEEEVIEGEPEVVAATVETMSLKRKVSQLMLVTMQGITGPGVDDLAFLKSYTPAGAIIRQLIKPANAIDYVNKIRGVERMTGIPLLVGANLYELTKATRNLPSAYIQLPSPLAIAAAQDPQSTERMGLILAEFLGSMGFNLHLGPKLELAPTLADARGDIYNFGSKPEFVAEAGCTLLKAMMDSKIIPVPMGFPGGGLNRLPKTQAVLLTPRQLLLEADAYPYMKAIEAGAPLVHVGNTLTPSLDASSAPASLSAAVMRSLLRETLDFKGVVLAGPMDSSDILSQYDAAEASIQALKSGADMLYWRGPYNQIMRVIDKIVQAVNEEELAESVIDAAVERILLMKTEQLIAEREPGDERKAESLERKKKLAQEVYEIERRAITLVKNSGGLVPLAGDHAMPVGLTGVVGVDEMHPFLEEYAKPISMQPITTAQHLGEIQDFEITRITSHIRGIRTVICVLTDSLRPEGQIALIRKLKETGVNVVVVMLGYPRYLDHLAIADAIVLAYCDSATYGHTVRAVADVLMGAGPIRVREMSAPLQVRVGEERIYDAREILRAPAGRLPVDISANFPAGLSATYDAGINLKKVVWDFGSGDNRKEIRSAYAYRNAGVYTLTLNATDRQGNTITGEFSVEVSE